MAVPNIFGSATSAIPLSQLDQNFATAITLGNTAVYLGNTTTSLGNVTLTNVTISSGNVSVSTATVGAGSNTAPSITTTGDTNTGIFFPAADTIAFTEGGVESARIDASGNLGLGVTPSAWAGAGRIIQFGNGNASIGTQNTGDANFLHNAYESPAGTFKYISSSGALRYQLDINNNAHKWFSAASGTAGNTISFTQAMTLDASGNLLVGTTSGIRKLNITYTAASGGIYLETSNADSTFLSCIRSATVHVQHKIIGSAYQIVNDSAGVSLAAGGTSWGSLSDERKKDIIEPIVDAATKVSSLRAVIGKYKTEEDGIRRAMLIAQDVQAVLPEAVVKNQDGDLILQYTETIPLLVAAIQEQQAIITQLQADVAALKGTA